MLASRYVDFLWKFLQMAVYDFLSEDWNLIKKHANCFIPDTVLIPLECCGQTPEILVREGDSVKEGQVLAEFKNQRVHSSIPGKVVSIKETPYADGNSGLCAEIALGGAFTWTGKKTNELDWKSYEKGALLYIFSSAGVVNTFEKTEPLSSQIENLSHKNSYGAVVCRLYSEDPSRISDNFLTSLYLEKIKTGVKIVAKAAGAKCIIFAKDSGSKDMKFDDCAEEGIEIVDVSIDSRAYPSGFKREIVRAVKMMFKGNEKKQIPESLGCNEIFIDVQTAIRVYEAVVLERPVTTCDVHVSGDCLNAAGILSVRIGTPLKNLVELCGNFKRKPAKIVINGIVTGCNVSSLDVPVTKDIKSVAFIPQSQVPDQKTEDCIRCGACRNVCPAGLFPESLFRCYVNKKLDPNEQLIKKTSVLCTECALCNSVCPSRIQLCQIISKLKENKKEEA